MRIKSADQLRAEGVSIDEAAVKNNKARNPDGQWTGPIGNGPSTGSYIQAKYTAPTSQQLAQWERSYYLNTGKTAYGTNLTAEQLKDKYGAPQLAGGNSPPGTPTQPS
jgi:hypothetical protein